MRNLKSVSLAATLLLSCATFAQAQSHDGRQSRSDRSTHAEENMSAQSGRQGQMSGRENFRRSAGNQGARSQTGDSFQERAALRKQLRQLGFRNIQILNATYLVRAKTADGRTFLMVADPDRIHGAQTESSRQGPRTGSRQNRESDNADRRGSADRSTDQRRSNNSSGQSESR